jgi:hypothetical protein
VSTLTHSYHGPALPLDTDGTVGKPETVSGAFSVVPLMNGNAIIDNGEVPAKQWIVAGENTKLIKDETTTITTTKYVKKETRPLEAVKLTDQNLHRVADLVGGAVVHTVNRLQLLSLGHGEYAMLGDYVCRHSEKRPWFKLSRAFFEDTYEEEK